MGVSLDRIRQLVAQNLPKGLKVRDATLTQKAPGTRTAGQLTAGTNPAPTSYACKGFMDSRSIRRGDVSGEPTNVVTLIGGTLPVGIEPGPGDQIAIEGATYEVTELKSRDPAAAVYECIVQ